MASHLVAEERLQFVLLQEVRQPASLPDGWRCHPGSPDWRTEGRTFTTAIVCCDPSLTLVTRALHRLAAPGPGVADNSASHPGMAAAVELHVPEGEPVILISAYGLIDGGSSHTALHRLLSDLEPLLNSVPAKRVLLGGDLNSGDQPYDDTLPMHKLLWQRVDLLGFRNVVAEFAPGPLLGCSCTQGDACRHVRTQQYRSPSTKPWQADYILAMPGLQIRDCRALNEVPDDEWVSDHCPIVAELVL